MGNDDVDRDIRRAKKRMLIRAVIFFAVFPVFLMASAGRYQYWQGWIYYGVLAVPAAVVMAYLWRHDPALLLRRMKTREQDKSQRILVGLLKYIFFAGLALVGLDCRFQWSHVPVVVVLAADVFVFLGYLSIFWVFRENTYASRTLAVETGQKVIDTGPYAVVRHPIVCRLDCVLSGHAAGVGVFLGGVRFCTDAGAAYHPAFAGGKDVM